ncbi:MAG TPA: protein translocase subunit SecF [Gammaproteobacteria bacterium]|nr:protein translocase subunit SecF [Gammaproteobacteria bacterium]
MQWRTPNFNFVKWRRVAMIGSTIANLIAIGAIIHGLNYGVDFTGGVVVEASYTSPANLDAIRTGLEGAGFQSVQVQNFGSTSDVMIRLPPIGERSTVAVQDQVVSVLKTAGSDVTLKRLENIGPQVGEDLAQQGFLAMVFALAMVFIYVMVRFRWKLALGAIVATLHDVLITAGAFAVFGWQFDLTVLGSILAVLGYSLNDTIVIYDRIRDNFRSMRRSAPEAIVNTSVNQTLSRTVITSGTTLLTVIALFLFGGDALKGFSLALIIGIVVGTYSSVYVASSMALVLNIVPADFTETKTERVDELP